MTFRDDEFGYIRNRNGEIESIAISVKALKELRDHYDKVSNEHYRKGEHGQDVYYSGKSDVITDILECLEYDD